MTQPDPHPVQAFVEAIGTAVPPTQVHDEFLHWADARIGARERPVFARMAARAGIARRWSVIADGFGPDGFYRADAWPGTAARMAVYADAAPTLALAAIDDLAARAPLGAITHLVVASCTGFVAPGIDQVIAARLGLAGSVERLLVGFMGCYAAVAALRSARHIVRSDPAARVLVVAVELSTLHLQRTAALEPLLGMMQFGDGAAAALVSAAPAGFTIDAPFAATITDTAGLIRWTITDEGFVMDLSGEVPRRVAAALAQPVLAAAIHGEAATTVDCWAVHAGGRSILDAVEGAFALPADALAASRGVLHDCGNMSSATLLFVLARLLDERTRVANGVALAFGPGLAAEGFRFRSAA